MNRSTRRRGLLGLLAIATAGVALTLSTPSASATWPLVTATLKDTSGAVVGKVVFIGRGDQVSSIAVHINASAAPALGDFHGFHVHTTGVCNPDPAATPAPATQRALRLGGRALEPHGRDPWLALR